MFTRILTDLERRRVKSYLKQDGEKDSPMAEIASRAKEYLPAIRSDLELLEKLLATYAGDHKKDLIGPRHL